MAKTIAIAGKGGVGKTTIAALFVKYLSRKGVVLAIDADPSANLNQALGTPITETIGSIREGLEEMKKEGTFSPGITKKEFLDLRIREAIVETDRVDLLAMGRPEGPGYLWPPRLPVGPGRRPTAHEEDREQRRGSGHHPRAGSALQRTLCLFRRGSHRKGRGER